MKKGLFILLLTFLIQSCSVAFGNTIRFVQVTDTHFEATSPYEVEVLKSTVKDINTLKDISFVVFTGDNINRPKEEDLKGFFKVIKKLNVPYYIVLGNHDVFKSGGLSKVRYNEILRSNNIFWLHRQWNYSFKKNGFTFFVVDGAKEVIPGSAGYYRDSTLAWLDKQLSKKSTKQAIIFQHYPIIDMPNFERGRLKTHRTYAAEKYLDMINKHDNVVAILSGHYHVNSELMSNGVYHISTPTLLKDPPKYKIIDIVNKKGLSPIIYTQLREVQVN